MIFWFGKELKSMVCNSLKIEQWCMLVCSSTSSLFNKRQNFRFKLKFVLDRVESVMGKEQNAGYQHFLLFPQYLFKRLLLQGHEKSGLCGKELILHYQACGKNINSLARISQITCKTVWALPYLNYDYTRNCFNKDTSENTA